MDPNQPPILGYAAATSPTTQQRPSGLHELIGWLVPLASGAGAGWLLGHSGYGWFCAAVVFGFAVGLVSAAAAPRLPMAYGLLGNVVTVAAVVIVASARGSHLSANDILPVFLLLGAVVVVPGAIGAGLVALVRSDRQPAGSDSHRHLIRGD